MVVGSWKEVIDELPLTLTDVDNGVVNKSAIERNLIFDDILDSQGNILPDCESLSLKKIRKKVLAKVEKKVIVHVLNRTKWNRIKAAGILQINYKTLLNKINDLKIEPPGYVK